MIWAFSALILAVILAFVFWPVAWRAKEQRSAPLIAGASAFAVAAAAFGGYSYWGSPHQPGAPIQTELPADATDVELPLPQAARILAARMKREPEDPRGWEILAGAYMNLGEFPLAADAFTRALHVGGPNPVVAGRLGTALVLSDNGDVSARARDLFLQAQAGGSEEPEPAFFLAVYEAQAGRPDEAIAMLKALRREAASPFWQAQINARLSALAGETDQLSDQTSEQAVAGTRGGGMPVLSAEAREAAAAMAPEERNAMIRGMVESLASRLEEQPEDWQGWMRLARARQVLEDGEAAAKAAAEALARAPEAEKAAVRAELGALGLLAQ